MGSTQRERTSPVSLPISIHHLGQTFGTFQAIEHVDARIAAGEFISLIGPSGCGKTTLLRLVGSLETPTTGEVLVGGETPLQARRQRRLGLVSQRPAVLPWKTARGDVQFTQTTARRKGFAPMRLLRDFGLAGHENKRPHQLSGGMLQRVNFASAIAHDPQVLLMDEPFSALDEMRREELGMWLSEQLAQRPKTVLFVTHHIDEAVLLSDRVLVFSAAPGRIVDDVRITAPRPRPPAFRGSAEFLGATQRLRDHLFGRSASPGLPGAAA